MGERVMVTRKIRLLVDSECKEQFIEEIKKWKNYQYVTRKCANLISSHAFIQDNIKNLFYIEEGVRLKLCKKDEDNPDGVLSTSKQNTTYQVLGNHFKGELPASIMAALNSAITKTYSKERSDVMKGARSVRSYRNNIPVPFMRNSIRNIKKMDDANYSFDIFGTPFRTFFGRDRSYNKGLLENALNELDGYKLHDSSIHLEEDGNKKLKIYLLAVMSFPKIKNEVDPENEIHCFLDPLHPIVIGDKHSTKIGTYEDFNYGRTQIQERQKQLQAALKYSSGGKGRAKKLQALERFNKKEKNFVQTKLHTYSRQLINYCIKRKIGKIVLSNLTEIESENLKDSKETVDKFIIRNWSYYGLSQMIIYKAALNGIEVVIPKSKEDNKQSIEKYVQDVPEELEA